MTVDPAKDELRLLPHVGAKLADAMRDAGLYTIEDVAGASVDELCSIPGLGPKRAATVKQAAIGLLPDKNDGPAPWERQTGEKVKYYRWLTVYLELGPTRTLVDACSRHYRRCFAHPHSRWVRVSERWRWRERAEAWDGR